MSYSTGPQNADVLGRNQVISERSFYDLAEILICDPVAPNRAATRSALYSLGCRHIEMASNLRDFLEAIENRPPDLALCEAQVGKQELCHLIRELRHSEQSYNPFAIIIATAWVPDADLTTELLNSGADGLILRPFSAALLDQRIRTHIMQQKPYVVTDDYIGPERRAGGRPTTATMLAPPNSLRMKIEGRANPDQAIRQFYVELRTARTKLAIARQQQTRVRR